VNLCETCTQAEATCQIGAPGCDACVEYRPRDRAACRAAQLQYASVGTFDAWRGLCHLIELEAELSHAEVAR